MKPTDSIWGRCTWGIMGQRAATYLNQLPRRLMVRVELRKRVGNRPTLVVWATTKTLPILLQKYKSIFTVKN